MPLATVVLAAFPVAWLLPNHYLPWLSAWSDGVAIGLLSIALVCADRAGRLPKAWAAVCAIALVLVLAQTVVGRLFYAGDTIMVALYIMVLVAAAAVGGGLVQPDSPSDTRALDTIAAAIAAGAIASVGVALLQWTGSHMLGIWAIDLPPRERPFGNVAQPNHLCTICFLGLCSLGLLRHNQRVQGAAFWLAALFLLWGMVMTGSRTGWVQVSFLAVFLALVDRRARSALGWRGVVAMAVAFIAFVLAWPLVNDLLLLTTPRTLADSTQAGLRALHWRELADAITQEPLWGYGWTQVGAAQVRVADLHPYTGEYIDHSHNIALDLLLWNGVPIGALLIGLIAWWFLSRLVGCRNAQAAWLLAGIGGLFIHGLLEYPLEYAYFLIPLGLAVGAVEQLSPAPRSVIVGVWPMRAAGLVLALALGIIGQDYLQAEQAMRVLRFESAHIGVTGITTPPPRLLVLNQLEAYLRFAQTEAREGMTPEELEAMRRVSTRFAYPPSMFRYALALGLNGHPDEAALTLKRLCRMHAIARCREAREGWEAGQGKFPALRAVAAPTLPDTSIADQLQSSMPPR